MEFSKYRGGININVKMLPTETGTLTTIHEALACEYRRRIIKYMIISEDNVVREEELITALHEDDEISTNREHIAVKLRHTALPKLTALGFIWYDERNQTVQYLESPVLKEVLFVSAEAATTS